MMRARSDSPNLVNPSAPNMATSGSPGRTRITTKTMTDTPKSAGRLTIRRRSRYFCTSSRPAYLSSQAVSQRTTS